MNMVLIRRIRTFWREPLVHFLVIGALLFLVYELKRPPDQENQKRIVVTAGQVDQLRNRFERTWLRPPSDIEMTGLIDSLVRDEVYFREALAMGLDESDPIMRRRMRQKLEFLLEDLSAEMEPDDTKLTTFLHANADKFRTEPKVSFRHVYLNPDGGQDLKTAAGPILARLRAGEAPETVGDTTLLEDSFTQAPQHLIASSFGSAFAKKIVRMTPGQWAGPINSGLGAHLVLVTERFEGRLPELEEVRAEVEREYMAQYRRELKERIYQQLRGSYNVVVETTAPKNDGKIAKASTNSVGAIKEGRP